MGLDTTHDCWHGAYPAFGRWRNTVAEAAGYKLIQEGYLTFPDVDWARITDANLQGEWDTPPEDPLVYLIAHSDCDGKLPKEACGPLADRLEGLLDKLPGEESDYGHIFGGYRATTERFIKGLRKAAKRNQSVGFH